MKSDSLSRRLFWSYYNLEKCHLSNIFYVSRGHEIKFMFRKINISKKKQFYQEIPIENMRYLNKKENLNFHQKY